MKLVAKTDIGNQRSENQDSYRAGRRADDAVWGVVCDGMGGPKAGDVASGMGVDIVARTIRRNLRPDITENSVRNLLITALATAYLIANLVFFIGMAK